MSLWPVLVSFKHVIQGKKARICYRKEGGSKQHPSTSLKMSSLPEMSWAQNPSRNRTNSSQGIIVTMFCQRVAMGGVPQIRKLFKNLVTIFSKNLFGKLVTFFWQFVHIFGELVHIFGQLVNIFGKLVHIFAWKLASRTSKQVSRNLGPLATGG